MFKYVGHLQAYWIAADKTEHNFKRDPLKDYSCKVRFGLVVSEESMKM